MFSHGFVNFTQQQQKKFILFFTDKYKENDIDDVDDVKIK